MVTFAAAIERRDQRWVTIVTIEGIGLAAGIFSTLEPYYFCSELPQYVELANNLSPYKAMYKAWLSEWPDTMSERVDTLGGVAESGELAVTILDYDATLSALFRPNRRPTARLTANCTAAATSITVSTATGITQYSPIFIGNEAMQVTAIAGTTLTVTRAQLGTDAAKHYTNDAVSLSSPYLISRRIRRFVMPWDADNEGEMREVGSGYFLDSIALSEDFSSWKILGRSQSKYLSRTIWFDAPSFAVDRVLGDEGILSLRRTSVSARSTLTLDSQWITGAAWVKIGDEILRVTGWTLSNNPQLIVYERAKGGTVRGEISVGDDVEFVLLAETTGPGSFRWSPGPTPSTSRSLGAWTKSDHWVDIMLCILTSSAHSLDGLELVNYSAGYGNWSSLPVGAGVGVPYALIDFASFLSVRERTPSWRFPYFRLDSGSAGSSCGQLLSEAFLKPAGAYLTFSALTGKLQLQLPRVPIADEAPTAIGTADLLRDESGEWVMFGPPEQSATKVHGTLVINTLGPGGQTVANRFRATDYSALYGQSGLYGGDDQPVDLDVMSVRTDQQGAVAFLERMAIRRLYRMAQPRWSLPISVDLSKFEIGAGTRIALTAPEMPDFVTGVRGWTGVRMEIVERAVSVKPGDVGIQWSLEGFGASVVAGRTGPAAYIVSVFAPGDGTSVLTCDANRYTESDGTDLPTKDVSGFTVGDVVEARALDGAMVGAYADVATVTAINTAGNTITVSANPSSVFAAGRVLGYPYYDRQTLTQSSTFVSWANAVDFTTYLGAAGWAYGEE